MSAVDEIFAGLAGAAGGALPLAGRVVDEIGDPVVGATVRGLTLGPFEGRELVRATTDATGRFELGGAIVAPLAVVAEAYGAEARALAATPFGELGELRLVTPLRLTASVGDGGENRPRDVRRLQVHLNRLGRLSDADLAAEAVDLAAAPPAAPGPRTLAALAVHLTSRLGRPPPVVRVDPGTPIARAVAELPPFPPTLLALGGPVGDLPGADPAAACNAPADVARVQQRLRQLGLLRPADHAAEAIDPAAAGPVNLAVRPRTLEAIAALDRGMAAGSLRAIVPAERGARRLEDPCCFGSAALRVRDTVGAGGRNLPEDVRAVQDRLLRLGHLAAADLAAERPGPRLRPGDGAARVADAAIPRTIAALQAARVARLGEPATTPGLVDPVDPAVRRFERPGRLVLGDTVGWGASLASANRPADVRRVQDRLLWLGLLARADHDRERVDPDAEAPIDDTQVPATAAALARARGLRGPIPLSAPVGRGCWNGAADVRAVQDRLRGLGFLSDADHATERVEPEEVERADEAELGATFEAIEALRGRLFELPGADPDAPWTAQARIDPDDETHRLLADPLFSGRPRLRCSGSVGTDGWNFPGDVRAIQDRLVVMRLLSSADWAAERVDPRRPGRVPDAELAFTRAAIARLRTALLGEAAPVVPRIEVRSAAMAALDDRLGALRRPLELTGAVGWDGDNAPPDVIQVLDRLHGLGFLPDEDHARERAAAEAVQAAGGTKVPDAQLAQGIAAIADWRSLALGAAAAPVVALGSETLRTLEWPPLPRRAAVALGGSVGRNGANAAADVRRVQDRLFELGALDPADYFAERTDPAAAGRIPDAALGATVAAVERVQRTWAAIPGSAPDGVVDAGGRASRVLADPTFGTPTAPNPSCALAAAGPAAPVLAGAALVRTVAAIEQVEAAAAPGEVPAILRNASGTPASWGRAQVIGGTAVEVLAKPASAAVAAFYGLDAPRLAALVKRAIATGAHFDRIGAAVPAARTEKDLQAEIAEEVRLRGATLRAETGLGPDDVARMFRAAQLRRHLLALAAAAPEASLFDARTHPDAAANLAALGLSLADVTSYRQDPRRHAEHRAGFVTRALFHAPEGQALRNALTDDGGRKLGRLLIAQNWAKTANLGLDDRRRAMLTAYLHNHGGDPATLAANWATVEGDDYVQRVAAAYDAIH